MPLLIGAGVGALSSAAMGKSPFTGALMGGALGGLGGAGGLFSSAGTAGATEGGLLSNLQGISSVTPSLGSGGYAALGSQAFAPALSTVPAGIVGTTGEMGSSLLQSVNPVTGELTNAGAVPLTGWDKAIGAVNKVTAPIENWSAQNPMLSNIGTGVAKQEALSLINPPPQQPMQTTPAMPIQRGNYDPSSTLLNVSPNMGMSKEELARSKAGMFANAAHLTDADKRKIGDFYTSLIG